MATPSVKSVKQKDFLIELRFSGGWMTARNLQPSTHAREIAKPILWTTELCRLPTAASRENWTRMRPKL